MIYFDTICSRKPNLCDAATDILTLLSTKHNLIKITVFIPGKTNTAIQANKQTIEHLWAFICPKSQLTINAVAQTPLNCQLSVEYLTYSGNGSILISHQEGVEIVEIIDGHKRAILLNGINTEDDFALEKQAKTIFTKSRLILEQHNYAYNHIVRQWNYLPGILTTENKVQNYQIFNDIRSNTYDALEWIYGYPAATGIGVAGSHLSIDLLALDGFEIKAITNPDQVDAHIYSDNVLENGCLSTRTTPKFERAKLFKSSEESHIFISGTAAIEGEYSRNTNVSKQSELTLQHIDLLCQLGCAECGKQANHFEIKILRAYVKNPSDYGLVEKICTEKYPGVPLILVEADVCRNELLVEIEAFATITN